jgi:hypothetical protein
MLEFAMALKRPIGFLIFGIFNFVVAVVFIACGICSNVSDSRTWFIEVNGNRFDEKRLNEQLKQKVPGYPAVKITGIVLGYAVCVGLILSGASLLYGGLVGKIIAIVVYAGAFVHHVGMTIYQLVWVHPAINQFFDQIPPAIMVGRAPAEASRYTSLFPGWVSIAWWIAGCVFYLIAGLVVLISSTASDDEEVENDGKSVRDYDDEQDIDEEEEEEEERRPRKRKRKR